VDAGAVVSWRDWRGELRGESGALRATTSPRAELGGPGAGTSPGELFAAALTTSVVSTLTALARSRAVPLDHVESSAHARLEWGEEAPQHLARARIAVRVRSPADPQVVHALVLEARDRCPVCGAIAPRVPLLFRVTVEQTFRTPVQLSEAKGIAAEELVPG
jgi:organic hydroperoxide reductase OsmC/OhrA